MCPFNLPILYLTNLFVHIICLRWALSLYFTTGHAIIPKYYYVPADFVEAEQNAHGSQKRFPSNSGRDGKIFLFGQALYSIAKLLGM